MHLSLTAKAYSAAGRTDSAGHAMAILKVYQVKALKELHEDSSEPGLRQELCSAIRLCSPSGEGHGTGTQLDNVHHGDPGVPSLA